MIPAAIISLVVALAASWWGTGLMRRYAIARSFLEIPTEGSLRTVLTPRGGGVAIVAVVLGGIVAGAAGGWIRDSIAVALVPSGVAVALVSWIEDRRGAMRWPRFVVHLAASAWVVYCFGPIDLRLGVIDPIATVLLIAWIANLLNFMNSIDGLPAGGALTVGLAATVLCWRADDLEPTWLAALVVAATAGFLPWNWQRARILLGSVGAVFLGFIFGSLAVLTSQRGDIPALGWVVLLGVFVLDGTVTAVRRFARGERWNAAHQGHATERAVQAGLSPARVTQAVMAIDVVLALLVWWGMARPHEAAIAYPIALALVAILYWYVGRFLPM